MEFENSRVPLKKDQARLVHANLIVFNPDYFGHVVVFAFAVACSRACCQRAVVAVIHSVTVRRTASVNISARRPVVPYSVHNFLLHPETITVSVLHIRSSALSQRAAAAQQQQRRSRSRIRSRNGLQVSTVLTRSGSIS